MQHLRRAPWIVAILLSGPVAASAQQRVELPARDRVLSDAPTALWAVGTDEGESWEMFASISNMAFDANDNLYVLDQGNARVLVFDREGTFVRQFGKQGGGPGEFQYPAALNITRDGAIVVYDMMRRGYSVFDAAGNYVDHIAAPADYGTPRPDEMFAHPLGGVIARAMPAIRIESGVPEDSMPSPVFHQLMGEESTARTVYQFMMAPPNVSTRDAGGGRQMRMVAFSRPTFAVDPSWGVLPDGRLAISSDLDYRIAVTDPSGAVQSVLTRPIRGRQVTRRDQNDARDQRRREMKEGGGPGGMRVTTSSAGATAFVRTGAGGVSAGGSLTDEQIDAAIAQMTFAETIPAIQRVSVDPTGRIWVRRSAGRVGGDEPIDLIAADGRYIGTLNGQEVPMAVSRSGLAAWIEKNDLDVEQVVVRRLPRTWQ